MKIAHHPKVFAEEERAGGVKSLGPLRPWSVTHFTHSRGKVLQSLRADKLTHKFLALPTVVDYNETSNEGPFGGHLNRTAISITAWKKRVSYARCSCWKF